MLIKLTLGATILAVVLFWAWSQQRILMYVPDPNRVDPAAIGLFGVREITLRTSDGIDLVAWYGAAEPGQPSLLYFHGNAGNLQTRAGRVGEYLAKGRGMLMLSYRGYGGSGGKPTEANNVSDALIAYEWLVQQQGLDPNDIVLYGESLGSGIAVQLAAKKPVGGIILDAPYTSIADVGARLYPYLPVQTLILDRYDSLSRIDRIAAPLLIVHGENDDLIPISMGRALFEKAPQPKQFAAIPRAGHNNHYLHGSYEIIHAWLDRLSQTRVGEGMATRNRRQTR